MKQSRREFLWTSAAGLGGVAVQAQSTNRVLIRSVGEPSFKRRLAEREWDAKLKPEDYYRALRPQPGLGRPRAGGPLRCRQSALHAHPAVDVGVCGRFWWYNRTYDEPAYQRLGFSPGRGETA